MVHQRILKNMTNAKRVWCTSILCGGLSACGGQHGQYPLPKVGDTFAGSKVVKVEKIQPEQRTSAGTSNDLPAPRAEVVLQTKYTRAIPLGNGKFAYATVQQWVFHPERDKDGSLLCIEDENHCIELLKLKQQLSRPANDPIGIR